MFEGAVQDFLSEWLETFVDPRRRVFWGYLLAALAIGFAWHVLVVGSRWRAALSAIFSRAAWWSASARADYFVMALNAVVMSGLGSRLLAKATVAYLVFDVLHGVFDGRPVLAVDAAPWAVAAGFTACLFLLDDFARYWVHRWLHTVPVLWAFHRVHHSAEALNPFTIFRTHPVEMVVFAVRSALVQGVCVATFFFLFGDAVSLLTVLGASVITFAFNALGSNLRHSTVSLGYWRPLERILMSPAQHHVHHSRAPEHRDRNFGVALAVWDWLFGTHCHSARHQALRYGLSGGQRTDEHALRTLYLYPFVAAWRAIGAPFAPRDASPEEGGSRPEERTTAMRPSTLPALFHRVGCLVLLFALAAPVSAPASDTGTVNVYSARKEELILPLLERFEADSGIRVRLVTGKADGLLKRLQIEGRLSPADVFITVDAGRLQRAKEAGVLQPVTNEVVNAAVPAHLRDRDGYWFGISQRARTIIYAKDRVDASELGTYEGLADPKWKGRLCIRSSSSIYNQSLVASMIAARGEAETEAWARGLVANFARPPGGGDTDQLKATAAGQCDVTVVNTYYFGRLVNSTDADERAMGEKLAVFWPNQGAGDRGAHVNVSGVGITRHAANLAPARRLLEFLVTPQSQAWYAEVNHEYPVVPGTEVSDTLQAFGEFEADSLNLSRLGELNATAVKLMDRAGWR